MKKALDKIKKWFKNFISKKRNVYATIGVIGVILIAVLIVSLVKKDNDFALDPAYDIYPEEVRELYANLVNVSCTGDFHLNIEPDSGEVALNKIDKEALIAYLFSYLDKNAKLEDKMDMGLINRTQKELFMEDVKLFSGIKTYNYDNYEYTIKGSNITRKVRKCESDVTYVTHLYGYSHNANKDKLSMDVSAAYLKDGILYDYDNNELGEYNGDATNLTELTKKATYYRFVFYKKDGGFRLFSVEHKKRT